LLTTNTDENAMAPGAGRLHRHIRARADRDTVGLHAAMPSGEASLALFKPTRPGTYTFYCAPHYNKTTGEGMQGTLIVE
jgi:plastocyanin